jgi:hypothetical protein
MYGFAIGLSKQNGEEFVTDLMLGEHPVGQGVKESVAESRHSRPTAPEELTLRAAPP